MIKSLYRSIISIFVIGLIVIAAACGSDEDRNRKNGTSQPPEPDTNAAPIDQIAERFVKLALNIGQYDKDFVDAYQGPEAWMAEAKANPRALTTLLLDARGLMNELRSLPDNVDTDRRTMLEKQVIAAMTRIEMTRGNFYPFDEETRLLYDAVAPDYDLIQFDEVLFEIDQLLPGTGTVADRVDAFRETLAIPKAKLKTVFDAAIAECRRRTLTHYDLPAGETFRLEFVTDKPWSGYNWYQGGFESLIQVNTDFPIIIDRAVDLGCHEGYPGHHTWNVLLERDVLKGKGWIEYAVYPLFSPLSVTAEGSANYGIDLAFPGDEKIAFERENLFPLAGLDPAAADTLATLNALRARLSHARNHVARAYLDGDITREEAIVMSMKYNLMSRDRAEQSVAFTETYRGYVINYNLGKEIVSDYIDAAVAQGEDRWAAFEHVLRTPSTASGIKALTQAAN
ncbi:MAG: hypothetical protein AAGH42_08185 [Pseudomonadota bacterium]